MTARRPVSVSALRTWLASSAMAAWVDQARCAGMSTDAFFPERGDAATLAAAKAVCRDCPVRIPCLDHAMAEGELGVWGGTAERERRRIRRQRRRLDNGAAA